MKHSILAPICSAFILPGVGQVLNRQMLKGLALIGVITVWLLVFVVKLVMDFNSVLTHIDPELPLTFWQQIVVGFNTRNNTGLIVLLVVGACIWVYGIVDAYIHGKRCVPPKEMKNASSDD